MPIKNFCYCIGGVGSKISEVAGHLCAMNMIDAKDITFIVVDKDDDCGGTAKARKLLETVTALADVERNPDTALVRSVGNDKEFCKSKMDAFNWKFSASMSALTGAANDASLKEALIAKDNQTTRKSDEMLLDAFYSHKEQQKETTGGFYGHPSIGALIFKYMVKKSNWIPTAANNNLIDNADIAYPIREYLRAANNNVAKVFIIGSIFGGTGASIFSNLAHYIRSSLGKDDIKRVLISGALMLPYFTFPAQAGGMIDPIDFYSKSVVALKQYGNDENLLRSSKDSRASFDSIYVCGQSPLHCIAENYCDSGKNQKNHFNLVDLLAAQAMTEFFNAEYDYNEEDFTKYERGLYEYRFAPDNVEKVTLSNTVNIEKPLKAMTAFCTYFITRTYASVKYDNPRHSAVLRNLLDRGGILGTNSELNKYNDQYKTTVEPIVDSVFAYCCSFVEFMYDISHNGIDWSRGQNSQAEHYALFNPDYFERLHQITVGFKGDEDGQRQAIKACNSNDNADYVLDAKGITCQFVQDKLNEMFDKKPQEYKDAGTDVKQRIGDYIHSAFKVCFENV